MKQNNTNLLILPFWYQLYWTRAFSLIPFIFLLALIEYEIYGRTIPTAVYLILSVLITFLFVMFLYHPLQKLFVREGKIIISEDTLTVVTHHKNKVLHFDELEDVSIARISLYGSSSASGREDDYSFRMISRIISERIQAKE